MSRSEPTTTPYREYLWRIFATPRVAAGKLDVDSRPNRVSLWSYLLGVVAYVIIVLQGYSVLGWGTFPYNEYYPHYPDWWWWELLVVPVWGGVLALGFAVPAWGFGRWFGSTTTFDRVLAYVLLATIVSLPIMVGVDLFTTVTDPEATTEFAKYGVNHRPFDEAPSPLYWYVTNLYFYVAMGWQGVVTVVGLAELQKLVWWKIIPAIAAGMAVFFAFLLLIRDYVALII